MLDMFALEASVKSPTLTSIAYSVCLSFLLSSAIAYTYQKTFQGLSYSRNFIQALVLGAIVSAIAMQAIGDNLARGMGMMGALAIIRFRASLKDPKDMIFIFAALSVGIACGVYSYNIASIGTIGFCIIAFTVQNMPMTSETNFDGLLKFNMENDPEDKRNLETILQKHCKYFALVTLRELAQGKRLDYAYQVKLHKGGDKAAFIEQLATLKTAKGLTLLLQETTVEI